MGKQPKLDEGILAAILYSDVFDYPMNADEIHRYVIGCEASASDVVDALESSELLGEYVANEGDLHFLRGREHLIPLRAEADSVSAAHWQKTRYYGGYLRSIPGLKMALVTGSLAANNNRGAADVDLMCEMDDRRMWSTWLALRWITRFGKQFQADPHFCLNYIIGSGKREFPRTLYIAWELVKAVPLFGGDRYRDILEANGWIYDFLPNARERVSTDLDVVPIRDFYSHSTRAIVRGLHTVAGKVVESFEERREKGVIRRRFRETFSRQRDQTEIKYYHVSRNFRYMAEYRYRLYSHGLTGLDLYERIDAEVEEMRARL